jgi:hypothetical protein
MSRSKNSFSLSTLGFFCLSIALGGCVKDNRAIEEEGGGNTDVDGAMTSGMGDGSMVEGDGEVAETDGAMQETDAGTLTVVDASEPETDMAVVDPDSEVVDPPVGDRDLDGVPDDEDNCPDLSNSNQTDENENDIGDLCELEPEADDDNDGVPNAEDNCPLIANNSQSDEDEDGPGNRCDNCPDVANANQADSDGDGQGDACADRDDDGILDAEDNCPDRDNNMQENSDTDAFGDACDNCPLQPNADQADANNNRVGDVCEPDVIEDRDLDGVGDDVDNCPLLPNRDQADGDDDRVGDVCDNCPVVPNADQAPVGGEIGDACRDTRDSDGDNILDARDNCLNVPNGDQDDEDDDGVGDACDNCPEDPNFNQADRDFDGRGDACDELVPQLVVELSWGVEGLDFDLHMVGPYDNFGSNRDCWSNNRRFDWCDPGYRFDYPGQSDETDGRPYEQIRVGEEHEGWHTVGIDRYPNDVLVGPAAVLVTIRCGDNMPVSFGPYTFGEPTDDPRAFLEAVQVNPETCETNELVRFTTQREAGGVCAPVNCPAGARCDIETGECIDLCEAITCPEGDACNPGTGECAATSSDWGNNSLDAAPYCDSDEDCAFTETCYRVPVFGGQQVCGIPCGDQGDRACPEDFFCCDYRGARNYCVPEGERLGQNAFCRR